jgi:hypothetical protein
MTAKTLRRMLTLEADELDLTGRGFPTAGNDVHRKLDAVVHSFAAGYNSALAASRDALDFTGISHDLRGFAFEGAAMSRTLLDLITLTRGRRLRGLAHGPGQRYIHLIHVGAGWAFARMRVRPWTGVRFGDPFLRWLAWDGWGFHQAYFKPLEVFTQRQVERAARSDVRPIRDQGAGRALWFYAAADPTRIAEIIGGFAAARRADLWSGVGLAASYTGAQAPDCLDALLAAATIHRSDLAQGAAFAAKAHVLSGAVPPHSATAIEVLTGVEPVIAADWTDVSLREAARGPDTPAGYQAWRAGIRRAWERQAGGVRL